MWAHKSKVTCQDAEQSRHPQKGPTHWIGKLTKMARTLTPEVASSWPQNWDYEKLIHACQAKRLSLFQNASSMLPTKA
jgi:hypothetical protein